MSINYSLSNNFAVSGKFLIDGDNTPESELTNYNLLEFPTPGITLAPTPLKRKGCEVNVPGDTITYDSINVSFLLDEDYVVYNFLYELINSYRGRTSKDVFMFFKYNNKHNLIGKGTLYNCWISNITGITHEVQGDVTVNYVDVTMYFTRYKYESHI